MKKVPGVEKVEASLNRGKAIIQLQPDNTVRLEQLIQIVRDKAFDPKEARVTARGELLLAGGKLQLKITGTSELYELKPDPKAPKSLEELKQNVGKVFLVEGTIPAAKNKTVPKVIQLQSFKLSS